MSVLDVVTWPAKVLETRASEVTKFDADFKTFVADMHETMKASAGIGLAANQVGDLRRVVTIEIPWNNERYGEQEETKEWWHDKTFTFVNPVITKKAGKFKFQEGCLSFPEIFEFIERAAEVWVKAQDENGKEFEVHATGLLAVCLQHEIDHIDGIVFINRMSRLKAGMVRKKIARLGKDAEVEQGEMEPVKSVSAIIVAPSLLSADPMRFGEDLATVERAGADWHHVDVMDGHFVPNLTYGVPFVAALKKTTKIPLDVHIMVSNPDVVALDYVKAGADILVFHVEAAVHAHRLLQAIHGAGAKAGLAVNPGTPLESVYPLLDDTDVIMLMSVNPGFGGQKFIPQTVERVAKLSQWLKQRGRDNDVIIEVDGGINAETGKEVVAAGARALVAGTYVYGAKDRAAAIRSLHETGK